MVRQRTHLAVQIHQPRNFIEQCNCGIVIALVFADKGYYLFGCRSGVVRGKGDSEWRVTGERATLPWSSLAALRIIFDEIERKAAFFLPAA